MMETGYDADKITQINEEDAKSDEAVTQEAETVEEADEFVTQEKGEEETDYEALIASDVLALKAEFPELQGITDITDLNNPLRYAALRDLGLSPAEAYMATAKRRSTDTRSHLKSAHGRGAAIPTGMMTQFELATARELFPGMSDSELQRLYKRVTK